MRQLGRVGWVGGFTSVARFPYPPHSPQPPASLAPPVSTKEQTTRGMRHVRRMTLASTHDSAPRKPLRLWPGVTAVVLQWLGWLVFPIVAPDGGTLALLGALACGAVVFVWWLFFSRAPWPERAAAIVLIVVAVAATSRIVHESIANGMMGMMLPIYAIPVMSLALVAWAVASRHFSLPMRRVSMVVFILIGCGALALVRTGGITGDADSDFHWRWTPSPEERLLAHASSKPAPSRVEGPAPSGVEGPFGAAQGKPLGGAPAAPVPEAPAETLDSGEPSRSAAVAAGSAPDGRGEDEAVAENSVVVADRVEKESNAGWPGFRGPLRDGVARGVRIETDWSRKPPVELWRRPIGPGWSSFAVHGNRVYTQEQLGEEELVTCYNLATGEPVWRHADPVRFWESNAGAGPRGTPTLSNGRVYTSGATGIVNALDAGSGSSCGRATRRSTRASSFRTGVLPARPWLSTTS